MRAVPSNDAAAAAAARRWHRNEEREAAGGAATALCARERREGEDRWLSQSVSSVRQWVSRTGLVRSVWMSCQMYVRREGSAVLPPHLLRA